MKLQTPSALLLRQALQKAAKAIDYKASIVAMTNVLLKQRAGDGKFFFVSGTTDLQLTIPAPLEIVEGSFQKPVVLPIVSLLSLLSTLPSDCVVTMDLQDGDKDEHNMIIEYCTHTGENVKSGKVSLAFYDGNEYPQAKAMAAGKTHVAFPMAFFKGALAHAGKFITEDPLRPVMCCLCIDIAEDRSDATFVASNGHTLIKLTHTNDPATGGSDFFREGDPGRIMVHYTYFKTLSVFDDCEDIDIEFDGNLVKFTADDMECLCKGVDGKYPNYNSVIPRNNPFHVVVDKKELVSVVKRVALFASESSNLVRLKKDGMFLNVSASDVDFSTSAEDQVLITDSKCSDGFQIGFKASSLLDTVSAIPGDTIRLQLADPSRPGVITADDPAPKALTLLMPMLLNN